MQWIYIIFIDFLLKNGLNSNKVGKGHNLPLRLLDWSKNQSPKQVRLKIKNKQFEVIRNRLRSRSREFSLIQNELFFIQCHWIIITPYIVTCERSLFNIPRTDGGPSHLSTDVGGGRITAPPGDIKNEASYRQAVNGIGYGRTSSTIFNRVIFRSGKKWRHRGKKVTMAAPGRKGVFCQ